MASMNKAILMGHMGKDPEVRMTQSGQQVASVSIATSEKWTKDGKTEEKTEWHNIVIWGKTAENVGKYCKKGSCILVEGKITNRNWEDPQGQKHYKTEIVADKVTFISKGTGAGGAGGNSAPDPEPYGGRTTAPAAGSDFSDDDVPF